MVVNMANLSVNGYENTNKEETLKRTTVYAGDMKKDPKSARSIVEQRKEEAQKQALKIVSDAFAAEHGLDETVDSYKEDQANRLAENVELMKEKAKVEKQIDEGGLDDAGLEDAYTAMEEYTKRIEDNQIEIDGASKALQGIRISRNKSHAMVDAKNQGDTLLENASKQAINTLLTEGKDQVDETIEEEKEEAESKEEDETSEEQASYDAVSVDQELSEIRDKMKVLEEDLKGAAVDEQR